MIISREIYEAVVQIGQQETVYQPGFPMHEAAIAAGVARINGDLIELTHKGEEVARL